MRGLYAIAISTAKKEISVIKREYIVMLLVGYCTPVLAEPPCIEGLLVERYKIKKATEYLSTLDEVFTYSYQKLEQTSKTASGMLGAITGYFIVNLGVDKKEAEAKWEALKAEYKGSSSTKWSHVVEIEHNRIADRAWDSYQLCLKVNASKRGIQVRDWNPDDSSEELALTVGYVAGYQHPDKAILTQDPVVRGGEVVGAYPKEVVHGTSAAYRFRRHKNQNGVGFQKLEVTLVFTQGEVFESAPKTSGLAVPGKTSWMGTRLEVKSVKRSGEDLEVVIECLRDTGDHQITIFADNSIAISRGRLYRAGDITVTGTVDHGSHPRHPRIKCHAGKPNQFSLAFATDTDVNESKERADVIMVFRVYDGQTYEYGQVALGAMEE